MVHWNTVHNSYKRALEFLQPSKPGSNHLHGKNRHQYIQIYTNLSTPPGRIDDRLRRNSDATFTACAKSFKGQNVCNSYCLGTHIHLPIAVVTNRPTQSTTANLFSYLSLCIFVPSHNKLPVSAAEFPFKLYSRHWISHAWLTQYSTRMIPKNTHKLMGSFMGSVILQYKDSVSLSSFL